MFFFGDRGWITSLSLGSSKENPRIIISRRIKMFMTMQMKVMLPLFRDSFGIIINISFGAHRARILSSSRKSSINLTIVGGFFMSRRSDLLRSDDLFLLVGDKNEFNDRMLSEDFRKLVGFFLQNWCLCNYFHFKIEISSMRICK